MVDQKGKIKKKWHVIGIWKFVFCGPLCFGIYLPPHNVCPYK